MNNTILLIVGASGTGKTSVANLLTKLWDLQQLESYTTREPRYSGEKGHIFVTNGRFDELTDIVAYTEFDGNRYCATADQIEDSDIYIIDLDGVDYFRRHYRGSKTVKVAYLYNTRSTRFDRMLDRGDKIMSVIERVEHDDEAFSRTRVDDILSYFDRHDVLRIMNINKLSTAEKIYSFIKEN